MKKADLSKKHINKSRSKSIKTLTFCGLLMVISPLHAEQSQGADKVDASDPTRITTFMGIGPKITEYTDGTDISEVRVNATIGLGPKDMVIIQTGYGHHSGEDKSGFTNTQVRHFHLFSMDKVEQGYRGWGSSIELNVAGELTGMDGQTSLAVGASPAIALGNGWDIYPILHVLNSWDKNMEEYNGGGINISPLLVKSIPDAWNGAFVQFWPKYNSFLWGNLEGNGGGSIEVVVGGKFTDSLVWKFSYDATFDKDFKAYKHDEGFAAKADQSFYFRIESYF